MKKDNEFYKEWVIKAQNDLETAEILLREDGPSDTLCFHCHQAVEKYLKAYLVFYEMEFEKIHDVWKLAKLCSEIDQDILDLDKELKSLNAYYIESRYPADVLSYGREECREALSFAKKIISFVSDKIL